MGAGRKTQTFLTSASAGPSGGGITGFPLQRGLSASDLGGVIFGCTNSTHAECMNHNLFGLPQHHIKYVQHIRPGMCLFLFNYSGRMLHGIYEAVGEGALNIEPNAWTDGKGRTQFPAQVKFRIKQTCSPLPEAIFKEAISENYYSEIKFTFELTSSQKDHLVHLFTKNMEGPTKSLASKGPVQSLKIGGPLKVWKEASKVEDAWAKPKNSVNVVLGNAWGQVGPSDSGKAASADDVRSYDFHQPGFQEEEASDSSNELSNDTDNAGSDDTGSTINTPAKDIHFTSQAEKDKQETEYSGYKPNISTQTQAFDARYGESSINISEDMSRKELDKAARQRVLEKLQKLDPSRADFQEPPVGVLQERFQGLDVSNADLLQAHQSNLNRPLHTGQQGGLDTSSGSVVAVTPMKTSPEWERQAREKALKEQAQLKEECDRLWATASAVDMNVATAFKRCLEVSAATIAQMRQESIELHRIMIEVRARAEQQLEQQKTLERLVTANTLMQKENANMSGELAAIKLEIGYLKSHMSSQGQLFGQPQQELYILGGLAETWLESVVAFSPYTNQCRPTTPLLAPRSYAASSILNNHIFLYGGGDGGSWHDTVECYSKETNRWESCPPMRIKRGSHGGVTVHDRLYAVGGGNGALSYDDMESYDPNVGRWIPSTKMLERRFCVAAAELNGVIYALGGFNGVNYLMSAERFDPREGLWSSIAPMSTRRGSLSAAVLNQKLYALGGFDGQEFLKSVEIYEPRANGWMQGPSMSSGRAYGAAAVLDNALYMVGGMESMNQSFETSTMKVEQCTDPGGWQPVAMDNLINRNFVAAAVL